MDSLPSLFDFLGDGSLADPLVAVATRVAGPLIPGDVESWDLVVFGDGFEALTSDPFSFAGHFLDQGLAKLRVDLLGPAGFIVPSQWPSNGHGFEYHATIRWQARKKTYKLWGE